MYPDNISFKNGVTWGSGQKCGLIADLGLTHSGDISKAFELIHIAKDVGADAVKFQCIDPDNLLGEKSIEYTYKCRDGTEITENMYEMFLKLEFSFNQWKEILNLCDQLGLTFITTSHTRKAFNLVNSLSPEIHKICSWSLCHRRLIEDIGKTKKAMIIDTGPCDEEMLLTLNNWYQSKGGSQLIVLHDFHTNDTSQMNFGSIPRLKKIFKSPVGFTPQGREDLFDTFSLGLGVDILEMRLTTNSYIHGNGHYKALEPEEFKNWVFKIRKLEEAFGQSNYITSAKDDMSQTQLYFKSLFASKEIAKGDCLNNDNVYEQRPGDGIPASLIYEYIGKSVNKNIMPGHKFLENDFN